MPTFTGKLGNSNSKLGRFKLANTGGGGGGGGGTVTLDMFQGPMPWPPVRRPRTVAHLVPLQLTDPGSLLSGNPPPEGPVTLDKWQPQPWLPRELFIPLAVRLRRWLVPFLYEARDVTQVQETITLDKWYVALSVPVRRRPRLVPPAIAAATDDTHLSDPETLTVDKFESPWQRPLPRRKQPVHTPGSSQLEPTLIPEDPLAQTPPVWHTTWRLPVRPRFRPYLYPTAATSDVFLGQGEAVHMDALPQTSGLPAGHFKKKPLPLGTYGSLQQDVTAVGEPISVDKFESSWRLPVPGSNPRRYLYEAFVPVAQLGEVLTPDKFESSWQIPVRRPQRPAAYRLVELAAYPDTMFAPPNIVLLLGHNLRGVSFGGLL